MPSQSVEAATRDEAIAAAREQFGPAARVVGVRRIRSGGMFGFFTNERFIAEVEVPAGTPTPADGSTGGAVLKNAAAAAPALSLDDRMQELADLLGAAGQQTPDVEMYGRATPARSLLADDVAPVRNAAPARSAAAAPARSTAAPRESVPTHSAAAAAARIAAAPRTARPASRPASAPAGQRTPAAKPFTPARHTLMLSAEELRTARTTADEPAVDEPAAPSPFAAALTRMVSSSPVQAAADAAAEDAAAADAAAEAAAADVAAAQAAAVEAAAAEAARLAAARIDAAAAEAARVQAARIQAAADAAAAAEAARIEAERLEAERAEAERLEAERVEAERIEAQRIEAERIEAERVEAERRAAEAAAAEAARVAAEAARVAAARIEAERLEAERLEAERIAAAAERVAAEAAAAEAARLAAEAAAAEAARVAAERAEAARVEAERREAQRITAEAERITAEAAAAGTEPVAAELVDEVPALSMVESVRSADEELAELLEEVLAANGTGRGRHRFPEAGAHDDQDAAAVAAGAVVGAAAVGPAAPTVPSVVNQVRDVPRPWAYGTTGSQPNAYDTGAHRFDAHRLPALGDDARVAQRAAQVAAAQDLVVDAVVVAEDPAEEVRYVAPRPAEAPAERFVLPMPVAPALARTASDPAPLPMDATTILPPLSLMPPQRFGTANGLPPLLASRPGVPPVRRSRPPVPASRPSVTGRPRVAPLPVAAAPAPSALPAAAETGTRLATVTRLVPAPSTELAPYTAPGPEELVGHLLTLGLPHSLLDADFAMDAAVRGVYAALTRTLTERLPAAPRVPAETGDVLMVVGPGAETLAAARSLAFSLRLDPEDVQWAASGALAGLAPESSRITSLETAVERRRTSDSRGTMTIVAVDAPLRTAGGPWLEHMLSVWTPAAVWAVMDSTRKPEDLVPWLDALPRLDAVVVQDTDATADPAAVLGHVSVPVALVDGARATAHRWASLLCERLEEMDA